MTRLTILATSTGVVLPSTCTLLIAMDPHFHPRKVAHFVVPIVPSGSRGWAMVALPAAPLTAMFHTSRSWSALRLTQVWAMPCCGHVPLWIHGTCKQALDSQGL